VAVARVQGQGDEIAGDDLTRIIGIGTKTAERLRARGIGSFAALAAHAPGEIIALLHDVSGLSAARVDRWRSQARALQAEASARPSSAADDPDPDPEPKPDTAKNGQRYESFLVRILLNEDGSVRRMTAQHVRTGHERHWPGLDRAGLPEFIETAVADSLAPSAPPRTPEPSAQLSGPTRSAVALDAATRSRLKSSAVLSVERTALRTGEPFAVTMNVEFETPQAARLVYSAIVVARPLTGGPKRTLAQEDGLLAASLSPSIEIKTAGLPAGIYRLDGAVTLREPGADRPARVAVMAEGLLLQVVPG
jgi:predicted flap endonuclease-1-like 5' DNA nuclease